MGSFRFAETGLHDMFSSTPSPVREGADLSAGSMGMEFSGAKVAVFLGSQLLVIRRDMKPEIPFPGYWDLPGGGRENGETPEECALREAYEEVGLELKAEQLVWSAISQRPEGQSWFFVAHLPVGRIRDIRFGDEGQGWDVMRPEEYCSNAMAIPHFAKHLSTYLGLDRAVAG